ncbi:RNA polymerase sigma-70 factor [Pedobacter sp. PLR]|uniref:RNA polymerase sigma factor n=1 Tax=Pedobacter sp. PLR TaxID=2994465 RepID=UPI0022459CD8|nr:RNA polymerase sigma-70 factor [Pedobacter sp. PLR]MCX2452612.1 RNA polymerase sigma-70 factor [Pedobacter sp. PLR]
MGGKNRIIGLAPGFTERELLHLVAAGDERAFNSLFEMHQQLIFNIAHKLTQSRPKAKEIVQDVFLKVWMKRLDLKDVENFGAYLNRIARNQSIDVLRKIAREALRNVELKETEMETGVRNTEDTIQYHETAKLLQQAVESLSPQQQKVYRLCQEQGLKYEEAAKELGISEGTVHTHMKHALRNIRVYLKNLDAMLLMILLLHK